MKARSFFYACGGIFLLALSYHLGARNAVAQVAGNQLVAMAANSNCIYAGTPNGDTYVYGCGGPNTWRFLGNIFGGPTPVPAETLGQLKARYR